MSRRCSALAMKRSRSVAAEAEDCARAPCELSKSTAGSSNENRRRTVPPGAAGWLALSEDVARLVIVPSKFQGTSVAVRPLRGFGGCFMKFRGGLAAAAAVAMLAWSLRVEAQGVSV